MRFYHYSIEGVNPLTGEVYEDKWTTTEYLKQSEKDEMALDVFYKKCWESLSDLETLKVFVEIEDIWLDGEPVELNDEDDPEVVVDELRKHIEERVLEEVTIYEED